MEVGEGGQVGRENWPRGDPINDPGPGQQPYPCYRSPTLAPHCNISPYKYSHGDGQTSMATGPTNCDGRTGL